MRVITAVINIINMRSMATCQKTYSGRAAISPKPICGCDTESTSHKESLIN